MDGLLPGKYVIVVGTSPGEDTADDGACADDARPLTSRLTNATLDYDGIHGAHPGVQFLRLTRMVYDADRDMKGYVL